MPDPVIDPQNQSAASASDGVQAVMEAVTELRKEVNDKKSVDLEKISKIESYLDVQEKKNQEFLILKKSLEDREIESKERLDTIEVELARSVRSGNKENHKESKEYKSLNDFCKLGKEDMDPEQKQLLRTDSDTAGGYLTTTELDPEITRKITEISNIRSVARVRSISNKSLEMAVRDTISEATYEGEAEENEDSASTYSNETLTTFRQTTNVGVTIDMLQDARFDMESEILRDAIEAFAKDEGINFIVGDGVKKPFGFIADTRVVDAARESELEDTVTATDVILLTGDLKMGYKPIYLFNRGTLAFLRTLKATDNNFLWQPGLNGPVSLTLNGFEYLVAEDMPDIADGAFPIAFADLQSGYTIIDRTGMSVVRDDLTRKKKGIVEFTINRWNYGQVTLPEAIQLLKVK